MKFKYVKKLIESIYEEESMFESQMQSFLESVTIDKVKDEVETIRKKMGDIRSKMSHEKKLGKGDSVLQTLSKEWEKLKDKVVSIWKQYDQQHGTKYALAYT